MKKVSDFIRDLVWKIAYKTENDPAWGLMSKAKQLFSSGMLPGAKGLIKQCLNTMTPKLQGFAGRVGGFAESLKNLDKAKLGIVSKSMQEVLQGDAGKLPDMQGFKELAGDVADNLKKEPAVWKPNYKLPNFFELAQKHLKDAELSEDASKAENHLEEAMLNYRAAEPILLRGQWPVPPTPVPKPKLPFKA